MIIDIIINYWLELLLTIISSGIVYVIKEYIGLKNGLKALLRNEIVRIYEAYSKLGYCPSYVKENVNEIYNNYHKLNGNGMTTPMINEINKLPVEPKVTIKSDKLFEETSNMHYDLNNLKIKEVI